MSTTKQNSIDSSTQTQTILIIDDNPNNLATLTDYLADYDFEILIARNGKRGIERAQFVRPDLILLDIVMPDIDGFETCRRLKSEPTTHDIPVIFMTALTETEHKVKGFQVGAVDYITKPPQKEEVLSRVLTHLRLRALNESLEQQVEARAAELQESEVKYRSLVENAHEGIAIVQQGLLKYANRYLSDLTGLLVEEALNRPFVDFVFPDERPKVANFYRQRMAGNDVPQIYETAIQHQDGHRLFVEINVSLTSYEGEPAELIMIRDLTARKRIEKALNERILAFTRPLDSAEAVSFADLFDLDEIQEIQDTFARATGVASIITMPDGTPITKPSNFCRLCNDIIRKTEKGLTNCMYSDAIIGRYNPDGPIIQPCLSGGLWDGGASITVGEHHIANWLIGQVRNDELDEDEIVRYARQIGADEREFRVALKEVAVMPKEQFVTISKTLFLLANLMSRIAYQNVQQARFITEVKQAEQERERLLSQIQEQARRVQQIIDTVPEGVFLLNAERQAILANPIAEVDLRTLADAQVGDLLSHLGNQELDVLLTPPPKGLWHEIAVEDRAFQILARSIKTTPVLGEWVLVIRDVTEQRKLDQQIQQRDRLAAVGQLAAGIAHDFNNIMATIVLYAQMTARTKNISEHIRKRMDIINQQAQHATNLIRQILDFSRRSVIERQPMDFLPFLSEQVKLLKRTLPENIKIFLSYEHSEYVFSADPTSMQQMIMNLVVNARDAMPEGGELHIKLDRTHIADQKDAPLHQMNSGDWVQITISDTGTGISDDILPHIFDPFFTTKAPGQGSGLGLPQVHGIVGIHEGYITVESELHTGTTFTIYFPALVTPSVQSTAPSEIGAPPKGQGETILLVEDNAATRNALVDTLALLNYKVLEAENGKEALDILAQHTNQIEMIISDVVMPDMGGIALLRALNERKISKPVLLLTGHPLERELKALHTSQAEMAPLDWMMKPPSFDELAETIRDMLTT